ncbi:MAG: agmatine deiminase family protein [Bacteroidales bacterium]
MSLSEIVFPAEWYPQSAVQLTWPHVNTDWCELLDEVIPCFINIAKEISKSQRLIIVTPEIEKVKSQLSDIALENISFVEMETNDTWARDHGPISVFSDGIPTLYDFTFNGWGMKFAANFDNQITSRLVEGDFFSGDVKYSNQQNFVLEGGSIESDGKGTVLTTSECLLSENRNDKSRTEMEEILTKLFGLKQVLWLDHGYLAGDDTDSHIDTLARFCDYQTIVYVKCDDKDDEHFDALTKMEAQLQQFRTIDGKPYRLIPLPMANPVYYEGERIPATYANFLIINGAVLLPIYNTNKDSEAILQMKLAFPDREIIGINCLPLIKQHGSLHCVTMQFPQGFVHEITHL